MMPNDPVVGGNTLRRAAIRSPNFIPGVQGWSINADGTAEFNELVLIVQSTSAAILIYAGVAGPGTLIGSWSGAATTDQFGNTVPAGLNASSGVLQGILLQAPSIVSGTIAGALLSGGSIQNAAITGGTMTETVITFDSGGGQLFAYSTTTTTVTQTAGGDYQITFPSNVNVAKVECTGAGSGGGGGNPSTGGETGGAGEYAAEPSYSVTGGGTYFYSVGFGGNGGVTNQAGSDGGDTFFDNGGVLANGGSAGTGGHKGLGGQGSPNTVHFNGGDGADGGTSTGGSSGANSGNATAKGNNGIQATTSSGAARPAAQAGSGQGGAGGANAANGSTGGAPGSSGGGAGSGSAANSITKNYQASSSRSWFGADASSPNTTRTTNSTMYQGGESAGGGSFNGTQKSACLFPSSTIQADFAGATMTGGTFFLTNQHSWFNNGLSVQVKEWPASQGTSLPSSWNGLGASLIATPFVSEGSRFSQGLSAAVATRFANGTDRGIAIGPGPGSLNLNYYGYFNGTPNNASGPVLQLRGTIGTGSNTAGDGADGQIKITYSSSAVLAFALAPSAGTDQNGNAFASGYTGPVTAFVPASNPTVAETVHNMPAMSNGWAVGTGGEAKYMLDATGALQFSFVLNTPGTKTDGITLWAAGSLPTGYRPAVAKRWPVSTGTNALSTNNTPSITFGTDGSITITGINTSGTLSHVDAHGVMPLF